MDMFMQSMAMQDMTRPGTQISAGGAQDSSSGTAVSDGEGSGVFSGMLKEMQDSLKGSGGLVSDGSAKDQTEGQEKLSALYAGVGMLQAALWWDHPLAEMAAPTMAGTAGSVGQMAAVSQVLQAQSLTAGQGAAADPEIQVQAAGQEDFAAWQEAAGLENTGAVQAAAGQEGASSLQGAADAEAGYMDLKASTDTAVVSHGGNGVSAQESAVQVSGAAGQDSVNAAGSDAREAGISGGMEARAVENTFEIKTQASKGREDGQTDSSAENAADGSAGAAGSAENTQARGADGQRNVSETLHLSGSDRTADIQRLLDMTEKAFVSDKGEISLQLEPEHLGKITIKAVYEHGTASVLITCSDPGGAERLSHYAADLGAILQERMGQPTEVVVDRQPDSYTEQYSQDQGREDRQESSREQGRRQKDRSRELDGDFLHQLRLGIM